MNGRGFSSAREVKVKMGKIIIGAVVVAAAVVAAGWAFFYQLGKEIYYYG